VFCPVPFLTISVFFPMVLAAPDQHDGSDRLGTPSRGVTRAKESTVDESRFDQSLKAFSGTAGRRNALGALGTAGMAVLAALGIAQGSDAKKHKRRDGKNHEKHQNQAERKGGGGKGKPGPTGPTGPTGPAGGGTGSGATGPTGSAGQPRTLAVMTRQGDPFTVDSDDFADGTAECNADEYVVGGGVVGFGQTSPRCQMVESFPQDDRTWEVRMSCYGGIGFSSTYVVKAQCISVA
jgi:hypothetical protein